MEKAMMRFWWGYGDGEHKHRWTRWSKMSRSKAKGGMGFREFRLFNLAILGKQLWRIQSQPGSLIYNVFKAKYFPRGDVQNASIGYQPSFVWRSLLTSRELLEKGTGWCVGTGRDIDIRLDRSVGTEGRRRPIQVSPAIPLKATVDFLVDAEAKHWKTDVVLNNFHEEDAQDILRTPLSLRLPTDRRIWLPKKHDNFTVRSAYHLAVESFSILQLNEPELSTVDPIWKRLWEVRVIPKIKVFLWRCIHDALPTKYDLARRAWDGDPICSLCGEGPENLYHIILDCQCTKRIWKLSPLRLDVEGRCFGTVRNFIWTCLTTIKSDRVAMVGCIAWTIWCARNMFYFEGKEFNWETILRKSQQLAIEMNQDTSDDERKEKDDPVPQPRWSTPMAGKNKLNSDVACFSNGDIGLGFIVRDEHEEVMLTGAKRTRKKGSVTALEGMAMMFGLQTTIQSGITSICVECDCHNLIEGLHGRRMLDPVAELLVDGILMICNSIGCSNFSYVPRLSNKVVHFIAHYETKVESETVWIEDVPPQVQYLVTNNVRLLTSSNE